MLTTPYPFCCLGKADTNEKDPYKKMFFKFCAKHRRYLVTLEFYSFNMVAIKYCDVKDKNSKKAYHKIFNDNDAFRVISTCFEIMRHYWKKNTHVNFVFYASLREIEAEILAKKKIPEEKIPDYIEGYRRSRYFIYRYGMLNLFNPEYFTPTSDRQNCIYVLMNKKEKKPSALMDQLQLFLQRNHDVIFNPD